MQSKDRDCQTGEKKNKIYLYAIYWSHTLNLKIQID